MCRVSDVSNQQHLRERSDDCAAVLRNDRAQQAEDADRRQTQNKLHDLHENLIPQVDAVYGIFCLISKQNNCETDEQRHDDDLQHVGIHNRRKKVGRKHVDENIQRSRLCLLNFISQFRRRKHRKICLEQVRKKQADGRCTGSSKKVINQCDAADRAEPSDIAQGDHACHNGKQYNRSYNKLDQIQENGTERLDVIYRKVRVALQKKSRDDCQYESREDLRRERHLSAPGRLLAALRL